MGKQIQRWQIVQAVCMSQVLMLLFRHDRAIDPAHARAGLIFKVAMILLFGAGAALAFRKIKVLKAQTPVLFTDPIAAPDAETVMTVRSRATREDLWRNELLSLRHRAANLFTLFFMSVMGALLMELRLWEHRPFSEQLLLFPVGLAFSLLCWAAFFGALLRLQINQRLPRPDSIRECSISLTEKGFQDITPEQTFLFAWREVTGVRYYGGDIHVWSGPFSGCFVSRSTFRNEDEARAFYERAHSLWQAGRFRPVPLRVP